MARLDTLAAAQRVDFLRDLGHRPACLHEPHDHVAVVHQVVLQLFEDRVVAEAVRVADVGDDAVEHRRDVEDHRHVGFELPVAREESEIEAAHVLEAREALERGAVAEPRERLVQPVVHAVVLQPFSQQARGFLFGDAGVEHRADGFDAAVRQLLDRAELRQLVEEDFRQRGWSAMMRLRLGR